MSDPESRHTVWSRPERGARGPAPERSRRQITTAALALADAEGLAAVSMRALAQRLGTGPASLYRYVAGRHDLLELMADAVVGEIDLTAAPSGDWIGDLVGLALQSKAACTRHPWLLDLYAQQGSPVGPHAIDYLDHCLAVLARAPGSSQQKLEAIGLVGGLVTLFARQELTATAPPALAAHLAAVSAEGRHPHLRAALATAGSPPSGSPADGDAVFARLLGRVLPGLLG